MCSSMHDLKNTCFYYDTRFTLMPKRSMDEKRGRNMKKSQTTHQKDSSLNPLNPSGQTPMQHATQKIFFPTQISIQATATSSQLLMRLWREHYRCPPLWHRLLTELKPLSSESDQCRQAYCYMRGLALVKTKEQKSGELNYGSNYFCFKSDTHLKNNI